MKEDRVQAWGTKDEIKAIEYIASAEPRSIDGKIPTLKERKQKLESWIHTAKIREWDKGVKVDQCQAYAVLLHNGMR